MHHWVPFCHGVRHIHLSLYLSKCVEVLRFKGITYALNHLAQAVLASFVQSRSRAKNTFRVRVECMREHVIRKYLAVPLPQAETPLICLLTRKYLGTIKIVAYTVLLGAVPVNHVVCSFLLIVHTESNFSQKTILHVQLISLDV